MELIMTDNAAIAVAATGGAAGPQADVVGLPEPVITVAEVWRLQLGWPWQIARVDAAVIAGFTLALAYVLADVFPQSTQLAQTWIFMKLLLVLAGLFGAFAILCTLWNKLFCAPVTQSSPKTGPRPRELKRELIERWIDDLPTEEQKKVEEDFIDPVGDGTQGELNLEITDSKSNIGEVLANHISLEEKRAKSVQPIIVESGCPGGDVAWVTVPVKKTWSQEEHLEVRESFLNPAEIRTTCFDCSLPQEGLNFTDESPEDSAESSTPVDESESSKEACDLVLSDMTASKDELDVGDEWQGAFGPEQALEEYEILSARPPSQPAHPSSAYSIAEALMRDCNASQSEAFFAERNALSDEMYAHLEKIADLEERSVSSQTAGEYITYGGHVTSPCHHRHCCRGHVDHSQAAEYKEGSFAKPDLLDDSRPMPGSYFGAPRSMYDTDHSSKFHLTVIPEDDSPLTV